MPGRVLSLALPREQARPLVRGILERQGWRCVQERREQLVLERGRAGRTILLGGLAGSSQYLRLTVALHERGEGCEVRLSWSERAGRELGGRLGHRRARRTLSGSCAALEEALRAQGVLRGARPLPD